MFVGLITFSLFSFHLVKKNGFESFCNFYSLIAIFVFYPWSCPGYRDYLFSAFNLCITKGFSQPF